MSRRHLITAFDDAFGDATAPCPTCLGPSHRGTQTVILSGAQELGRCEACSGLLTPAGGPAGRLFPDGFDLTVVRLEASPAQPPAVPGDG